MRKAEDERANNVSEIYAESSQEKNVPKLAVLGSVLLIFMMFALSFMITYNLFDVKNIEDDTVTEETAEEENQKEEENTSKIIIVEETQDDVIPDKVKLKSTPAN